jgi:hypothetical protein
MIALAQSANVSFPHFFALLLSGGSLLIYLIGAIVSRYMLKKEGRTAKAFTLGLPLTRNAETLFAVSLAAAQTTFSTVFVVFLTGAGTLGLHLLYCPFAFAVGNWVMLFVYKRIEDRGYIDQSSLSGLVPYLVYRLTTSRFISYCLVVLCVLPIVAVLALELHYGIPLLDHLVERAVPWISIGGPKLLSFVIPACFMAFMFGYVFVGGFRAVITSDVWQYRIMVSTLSLVCLSVLWLTISNRHRLTWGALGHPPARGLVGFYVGITVIDLLQPLCFATTWQRFRAFRDRSTDFTVAIRRATLKVTYLWVMLIFIGAGLQLVSPGPSNENLSEFLDRVAGLNIWFQLFVFPLVTVAGFSGMYSSSDTCVSALLYLTETSRAWREPSFQGDAPLRRHYYWVMAAIFALTFGMYIFVERTKTKLLDPAHIAITLFGNAVILAPTVLLLTRLDVRSKSQMRSRSLHIGVSIVLGFVAYWLTAARVHYWATFGGSATLAGLIASSVPAYLLLLRERRAAQGEEHV